MKKSAAWVAAGSGVVGCASVAVFMSYSLALPRENGQVSATYVHGVLNVVVPYSAPRNGAGDLTLEVLDPEDRVVGGGNTPVYVRTGQGLPREAIAIRGGLPVDDLVWHRLRYRFAYAGERSAPLEGIVSLSQVLRRPVVHVLDQRKYVSGGAAAVRVIATETDSKSPDNETPIKSGSLQIEMQRPGQKPRTLYMGSLNERGTTRAEFRFPAGLSGTFGLRYVVDTPLGIAEFTRQVELEEKASILLTTEKPVYQPGQTIHVRALALDQSSHQATGVRGLTFEVEDSRGNKVFKKITRTDEYGIASAEFALADEVNLGTYHLRALMEGKAGGKTDGNAGASQNKAEIALEVQKYVLPRFKVDLDLAGKDVAGKDVKARHGYRPGDHVTGTVRANYFFGKPLDRADVVVKATGRDVESFEAGQVKGTTDAEGAFHFDIRLPEFFAGHPLAQGAAVVTIEATVKDNAGHSETHGDAVSVSESPLLITAIPEGGALASGLRNELFILASYADGTPARAQIRAYMDSGEEDAETDQNGVAEVQVLGSGKTTQLRIEAKDTEGNRASVPVSLASRTGADQILVRTDRALYRAGDRMRLQVWSTKERGNVYIDLVKDGQTIATHDLDIARGRADLDIAVTPQMAGTVELHGYLFGRDGRPAGDRRLVFVQPADELKIETALDAPVYRPGGEARVGFHVTNNRGEGVQAALGLEVVDQAVFAMAEKQPGFAKVFFYLEQEMMKPRYEIHSVGLPETISAVNPGGQTQRDRAARALFSAMEVTEPNNASLDYGREAPGTKLAEYMERYRNRMAAQLDERVEAVYAVEKNPKGDCNREWPADLNPVDPWGHRLQVQRAYGVFLVRSAGPDGQLYNGDDLVANVANPWCSRFGRIRITRGRVNPDGRAKGGAEVSGAVTDRTGAVVRNAKVTLFDTSSGTTFNVTSDGRGKFRLDRLRAGEYRIDTLAPGFARAVRVFPLGEGESVAIDVMLDVGAVTEMVAVASGTPLLKTESGQLDFAMAFRAPVPQTAAALKAPVLDHATVQPPAADTHVRSWFPESLYVAPEIITDRDGRANITIPIADNITTWRMAMLASTRQGALGSGTSSLKVFQDFFTEMDLPVTLTQGDEVSIPVAIYNYAGSRGNVRLRLETGDGFAAEGDSLDKVVPVESGRVAAAQFTVAAKRIGKFKLTLRAEMDGTAKRADIVVREIEVAPNGREQTVVFNGRLDTAARHTVSFPANAIPESGTIFVRLYPGPLSQVVEGMDSLLHMPYGCFEQTSSATYPNVLALDYMKRTKKLTPEISAKAEGYIASGYQRLLTFEVQGGGFSWFGNAPANKILTSYGLMEFSDMAKVHDVDERVIPRTQQWLAMQQQPDGSWRPDASFINEGATNRYNSDALRITAYIAWALEATGYQGAAVDNAKRYIESHLPAAAKPDAYTLAVLANFATGYGKDAGFTAEAMRLLIDARKEQGDQVWWTSEETSMYARGASAAVETTGLAVQALLKQGSESAIAAKAMNYIVAKKDATGTWGSTQATILALRAMLLAAEKGGATAKGAVEVLLNGKIVGRVALTAENNDLLHQFAFKDVDARAANAVELRFNGEGSLAYQVAGRYFTPWNVRPAGEPLSIEVSYDRTRLAQDQIATATATVRNNLATAANMVMVDLGIPPGFDLLSEDLQDYRSKSAGQKSGRLEKYSLTPTQAVLYFDSIAPRGEFKLVFRLRAKYPIRARTFESRVYEYYSPDVYSVARPVQIEVRR